MKAHIKAKMNTIRASFLLNVLLPCAILGITIALGAWIQLNGVFAPLIVIVGLGACRGALIFLKTAKNCFWPSQNETSTNEHN